MASLSSTGISSGLNIQDLVSKIGAAERAPLTKLLADATKTQSKISALGMLRSKMADLQSASNALKNPTTWNGLQIKSSNDSAVSAISSGMSNAGGISIEVKSLAKAQALAAGTMFPAGAGWGAGTLRLQTGKWTIVPSTFTPGQGIPVDISIADTDTTTDIATKINGAQTDVKASVIRDANGAERLFLQGANTGEENGFQMSIQDADGDANDGVGLSRMMQGMTQGQYASNAKITIDGVETTSASNTFKGIAGLDLTIKAVTTTPVNIQSSKNTEESSKAVQNFIDKYNAVNEYLGALTKYDAGTKQAGILQGDVTATSLQNNLKNMVSRVMADQNSSSFGLTIERGGNLQLNASKFSTAMNNQGEALKNLFSNSTGNGAADSISATMLSALGQGGTLQTKELTYTQSLTRNKDQQARVNARAATVEGQYFKKFQALDSQLANMQAMSLYWSNQNNFSPKNF